MIIVKLQGGLGNQMFQYATAKSVSGNQPVCFDLSFLSGNHTNTGTFTARHFELAIFGNIRFKTVGRFLKSLLTSTKTPNKFLKRFLLPQAEVINETEINTFVDFNKIASNTIYLDGYFQNENYFKPIREQLLRDFKFPALNGEGKSVEDKITSTQNAVSVHVRRGDYLKPEVITYHGILPISYYKKAKEKIEETVVAPHYFIFSDDPEWCSSNFYFLGSNATIISKRDSEAWEDMYLMGLCQHHIIANSSYSWWGAWLNNKPNKIVIAPFNWFANNTINKQSQIVPGSWLKL